MHSPLNLLMAVIGWVGVALCVAAYALVSSGRLSVKTRLYQWMNIVGAAFLVIVCVPRGAWPSATYNALWVGIGVYSLWQMRAPRTPRSSPRRG